MAPVTVEDLRARQGEVRARLAEIDTEYAGEALPEETKAEWNRLNEEHDALGPRINELEARAARLEELMGREENREAGTPFGNGGSFGITRKASEAEIFDLVSIRNMALSAEDEARGLTDHARRAIEIASFPHDEARHEDVQSHLERLVTSKDTDRSDIARHMLATGSRLYSTAFGKWIAQRPLSQDEQRALSLTGSAGGYAVPFVLDPTIIPTSNLAVNPFRAISRVEQITVDEWRGVSSSGITAAYAAELTEASDNSPTLAQPTISTEKAQAFIPFSIEVGQDWAGLQGQMANLLQDAKDELEATKFTVGSGTNEPQGVITGATTTVTAGGTAAFAVGDVYATEAALGARFRPRASWVMNRAIAQRVRQFDTAGGANLWIDNLSTGLENQSPTPGGYAARLLGYPAYESSAMASTLTTGNKIGVLGDFRYYVIVDRIGLQVELIPQLLHVANNRPYGARGLYAYWRNGAGVLSPAAFRVLVTG